MKYRICLTTVSWFCCCKAWLESWLLNVGPWWLEMPNILLIKECDNGKYKIEFEWGQAVWLSWFDDSQWKARIVLGFLCESAIFNRTYIRARQHGWHDFIPRYIFHSFFLPILFSSSMDCFISVRSNISIASEFYFPILSIP